MVTRASDRALDTTILPILPAWVPCPGCDEWACTLHGGHASDCACPPVEEWLTDPYSTPIPRCERDGCLARLQEHQQRYCSQPCRVLAMRVLPRTCPACGRVFTPRGRDQRCCSRDCGRAYMSHPMLDQLLAMLAGSGDWFMTISDLAIWMYGDDGPSEYHAVRSLISRLRQTGVVLESRLVNWSGPRVGYRLAYRLAGRTAGGTAQITPGAEGADSLDAWQRALAPRPASRIAQTGSPGASQRPLLAPHGPPDAPEQPGRLMRPGARIGPPPARPQQEVSRAAQTTRS